MYKCKKIFALAVSLALVLSMFSGISSVHAAGVPVIFEATPNPAGPNETVQLIGENFDQNSMKLYRLPDTDFSRIDSIIGINLDESSITQTPATDVTVLKRSANAISGVIPANTAYGEYILWANNAGGLSNPLLANRTEVYHVFPDVVNVAKSREVTVIGKNLSYNNSTALTDGHVYLKNGSSYYAMALKSVNQYELVFDLPQSLPNANYEVWVNNGHGGAYGWGKVFSLSVVNAPTPSDTFNITSYGAVPNDSAADTTAIQSAVDAAVNAGGGTVLVPAGQYIIDSTLYLKHDIVLKGEGTDASGNYKSIIKYIDGTAIGGTPGSTGPEMMNIETRVSVEGLKIVGSVSIDRGVVINNGATDVVFRNNYVDNWYPATGNKGYFGGIMIQGGPLETKRILIENNTFNAGNSINLDAATLSKVSNNMIYCRDWTPVALTCSYNNIVKGNTIDGRNADGKRVAHRGITVNVGTGFTDPGYHSNEMNYFAENDIQYVGDEIAPTNDGEIIIFDSIADLNYPFMYFGNAASATSNTISASGTAWTADLFKNSYVLITYGKGVGQYKKVLSNTGTTLTVEGAWKIIPDTTSKFTVTRFHTKNIVANNTASHNKGIPIRLWGNCLANTVDGNQTAEGGACISGLDMGRATGYHPSYYNIVKNTTGPSADLDYRFYTGYGTVTNPRQSYLVFANSITKNTVTGMRMMERLHLDNPSTRLMPYNLMENNRGITSTIDLVPYAEDTIVRNNQTSAAVKYADAGLDTLLMENDTVVVLPTPTPLPNSTANTLLDEDFSDGVADGFNISGGTWLAAGGKYVQSNGSGYSFATYAGGSNWTDYTYSADVKTYGALLFRFKDTNNYYALRMWDASNIRFYKVVGGTATYTNYAYTFTPGTSYRLKIAAIGNSFSFYVNDTLLGTVTDSTHASGTVGCYTGYQTSEFDNLYVNNPVLLNENFTDGVADGFTTTSGTWSAAGGKYTQTNATGYHFSYYADGSSWVNYTVSADVKTYGTLLFRFKDTNNYYALRMWDASNIRFYKVVGGTSTYTNYSYSFTAGNTYKLKVVANGNQFSLYVNDTLLGTVTDSAHGSGTVGCYTAYQTSEFDNLLVVSPTPMLVNETFSDGVAEGLTTTSGTWAITNGKYAQSNATGYHFAYYTEGMNWTDYTVAADVKTYGTIVFRFKDTNNYYALRMWDASSIRFYKVVGGVSTYTNYSYNLTAGNTYKFRIVANGGNLSFYVNDTLLGTAADAALASGTVGCYTPYQTSEFDNLFVQ